MAPAVTARRRVVQLLGDKQAARILFEVEGVTELVARQAFALAAAKLPVKTRFVKREEH